MGKTRWDSSSAFRSYRLRAFFALLCSALLSAHSPRAFCSPTEPEETVTIYKSEWTRLVEISKSLSAQVEKQKKELDDSRRTSDELARMLASSKAEVDALKSELETLRRTSTKLENSAESSAQGSAELRTASSKAESSLKNLEASFESYRSAAEKKIARLERTARLQKIGLYVLGSLALSGWAAFAAQAAF
jgi:chromosome segregation ATPase